jgi:hypothetical protein
MARIKKSIPREVQSAKKRIDGMNSIEDKLDLGNGISVEMIETATKKVTDLISTYNTLLSQADQIDNDIAAAQKALADLTTRALKGCEFKYGRDSNEYEMVGGTRTSDRRRGGRKTGGDAPSTP